MLKSVFAVADVNEVVNGTDGKLVTGGNRPESDPSGAGAEELLTSVEVATRFGVDRGTVVAWGKGGLITLIRTPGGQFRFRAHEIQRLLDGEGVIGWAQAGRGPADADAVPPPRESSHVDDVIGRLGWVVAAAIGIPGFTILGIWIASTELAGFLGGLAGFGFGTWLASTINNRLPRPERGL